MGVVEHLPAGRKPYESPRPIRPGDGSANFDCGHPALNDWLKQRAGKQEGRSSRTYVVCAAHESRPVVGYYSLAAGIVTSTEAPGWAKRNMPNPIPIIVLGRLAVDAKHQGKGLGGGLLQEAIRRTVEAAAIVGCRALIVHAIDDAAITFYARYGFQQFPEETRTMFLPIETLAASL